MGKVKINEPDECVFYIGIKVIRPSDVREARRRACVDIFYTGTQFITNIDNSSCPHGECHNFMPILRKECLLHGDHNIIVAIILPIFIINFAIIFVKIILDL